MTTTPIAKTLEEAYGLIRSAGLTPLDMSWYVKNGIKVDGVGSVETWGPATYNHGKMYVKIEEA